jgi:hypothetical protein
MIIVGPNLSTMTDMLQLPTVFRLHLFSSWINYFFIDQIHVQMIFGQYIDTVSDRRSMIISMTFPEPLLLNR